MITARPKDATCYEYCTECDTVHYLTDDIESCRQKADHYKIQFDKATQSGSRAAQKDFRRQISKGKRRTYSQSMLFVVQDLYQLHNFKGDQRSILNVFNEARGIPIGSGDCCAPKLLHNAAQNGLMPLGLSEFYFGKENKSSTRFHKEFTFLLR